jgi:hypothetical protein
MCLGRPGGWAGAGAGRAFGLVPNGKDRIGFLFFLNYFKCENNSIKSRNCFKGMKNTQKIPKNLGKFPEIHWDMNNPNKVFGAHEKDFRAF